VVVNPHESLESLAMRIHPVPFQMYTDNGLLHECIVSRVFVQNAEQQLIDLINAASPCGYGARVILAGTSVGLDWRFLQRHMPVLAKMLYYRVFDVRTLMLECESRGLHVRLSAGACHRAKRDIECSIADLKACRTALQFDVN
jgi:oligoribonuclease